MSEEIEQVVPDTNKNTVESLMNAMGSLGGDNPYLNELKQIRTESAEENKEVIAPTNEEQSLPPNPIEGGENIETKENLEINPIFGDKNLAVKTETYYPIETPKELSEVITKFGVKDYGEFEQKIEGWKQTEEKYVEQTKQVENFESILSSLDPALYLALQKAARGEDWRAEINQAPAIDFAKSVDQIDTQKLVETFMPNEFTAEDWEEYNDPHGDASIKKAINIAYSSSKEKFEAKKGDFNTKIETEKNRGVKAQENFNESLGKSVDFVKKQMSDIDQGYLNGVVGKITKEGIVNAFYNTDGTLKETAIASFIRSTDEYENFVKIRINNAVKEAVNKERQNLLERGQENPNIRRSTNSGTNDLRPEVQSKLAEIERLGTGSTY
jgi:secreted Zn-dependent insulinase-like peptidase